LDIQILKLIRYINTSSGDFDVNEKWNILDLGFTLGYTFQFSDKYLLMFPMVGFQYQNYKNLGGETKHTTRLYCLVLETKFFISLDKIFKIGFNFEFLLLLSNIAYYEHPTNGEGKSIIRKGEFFYFRFPLIINISERFFTTLIPWFGMFHSPRTNAVHTNLDTGDQVSLSYNKMYLFSGGIEILFGVYF